MDQSHLIEAMDRRNAPVRRDRQWRTDRLATVIVPGSADIQASFALVAKYYGAMISPCPPRPATGKCAGVRRQVLLRALVAHHDGHDPGRDLDEPGPLLVGHRRRSPAAPGRYAEPDELVDGQRPPWPSVATLAQAEVLMAVPAAPSPATVEATRSVDERAGVAFRGNPYSVVPGMTGTEPTLGYRLGTAALEVFSPAGALLVCWQPPTAWRNLVGNDLSPKAREVYQTV